MTHREKLTPLLLSVLTLRARRTAGQGQALASGFFHAMFTEGVVVGAPLFGYASELTSATVGLRASSLAPLAVSLAALFVLRRHA